MTLAPAAAAPVEYRDVDVSRVPGAPANVVLSGGTVYDASDGDSLLLF